MTCELEGGDSRLLVGGNTGKDLWWIHSLRPPTVGTRLKIRFANDASHAYASLVTATRLDPRDALGSGFEIVLQGCVDELSTERSPTIPRAGAERRVIPRVDADELVEIHLPPGIYSLRLRNVSMAGALLVADAIAEVPRVGVGDSCTVTMEARPGDILPVPAQVARVIAHGTAPALAVRFLELDAPTAARLESFVLGILVGYSE